MVYTYIDYNLITRDMKLSLQRTADQAQVARETAYYKENIGKVTSIDAFMDDYQLYSYAMKAHGLEDMTYAKAFMRKVLESDLSDDTSYANKLTDDRYRNFAMAFSFSQGTAVVQSSAQEEDVIGLYKQTMADQEAAVGTDTAYFNAAMDKITTVDQLWQNDKLKNYVLTAYGFDPKYMSYEHFKGIVTSDVNDSSSYVNTQAASYKQGLQARIDSIVSTASAEDLANSASSARKQIAQYQSAINNAPDYTTLAAAFNFQTDGTLSAGDLPMTNDQKSTTSTSYIFAQPRTSSSAALSTKSYYESAMANVTSISGIKSNSTLFSYIVTAYGLPSGTLTTTFENIVTSDLSDPNSYANTQGGQYSAVYKKIAADFNFQADGTLVSGKAAQTTTQMASTSAGWMALYNDKQDAADETLISSFQTLMQTVTDVDSFLADTKITSLVLKAFGLENEGDTARKLKKVLTSDLSDPKSYANSLKDSRYTDLVKAFNFNADGSLGTPTLAQSESEILLTAKSYVVAKSQFGTADDKTKATEESKYYSSTMEKVESLDDFLSNKRLVDFVLVANGLDPDKVEPGYLRKMFESDLDDPKNFVNTEPDTRYRELVASFNFNTEGQIVKPEEGIQTRRGLLETQDLYYNQTLEEQEGEDNAGVRLALYFRRMAGGIGNAYDILADSALLQVIQTAFSIPEEMSSADVDVQYAYINRVLDTQDLQDPAKLEKLLVRFASLYDIDNNSDVSPAEIIMSGSGGTGISADTLLSLTQLRTGGA
ncbi:hypothetical protein QO002_001528 [Pararhizobium capsulatum DSM 1112]|uniref:Flagellar protein n=1 Tax=Pararhizobium capsulatum DSM 1112 TaxID=1121113 RepID=A0ABU0BMB3_9HYPH|nr:DUF1217 domain-containing protein [Pararhizobium capsulatum]MDQ0319390.1 hypothetical protein [Pararhizobium capsulatum DSM 1112]